MALICFFPILLFALSSQAQPMPVRPSVSPLTNQFSALVSTNANGSQTIQVGTNTPYILWPKLILNWSTVQFVAPQAVSNAAWCAVISSTNAALPRSNWTIRGIFPNDGSVVMQTFSNSLGSHFYTAMTLTNGNSLLASLTLTN